MTYCHILINSLSVGSGGGFTVARELLKHIASARPSWKLTMAMVGEHPLHEEIRDCLLPDNCEILWASSKASGQMFRALYETKNLTRWIDTNHVDVVVQLNGMLVPGTPRPVLAHNQDPYPYRPEAWQSPRDRFVSYLKRHAHAKAYRKAACIGWTSEYLKNLMCQWLGITPRCGEIYYNGVPEEWITRAQANLPDWANRPMELITVSNVGPYKRQDLVIKCLPAMMAKPGLQSLKYRIVGHCSEAYRSTLATLADSLGVRDRVEFEGRVSDQRLSELMSNARCFVLMSVCESFGIPAVEAMTFGIPVVASNCCAMPEVIGNAGALCEVDAVEELADILARVMTDQEFAEELRRRGVIRVADFSWAKTGEKMAQRIEKMLWPAADPDDQQLATSSIS